MKYMDLTGQRFVRLTVVKFVRQLETAGRHRIWLCRCDCGKEIEARQNSLRTGNTKSCGCLQKEKAGLRFRTHGHADHNGNNTTYNCWRNMRRRCYTESSKDYKNYGAIGIFVCSRWRDDFAAFLEDMGECPKGLTIDRINNDKSYTCGKCPECVAGGHEKNCRFSTRTEQNRNKRNSFKITHNGETKTLAEWCHQFGVRSGTVWDRLKNQGMSFEEAISKPAEWKEVEVEAFGEIKTISQWCKERGLDRRLVYERIVRLGWDEEDAMTYERLKVSGNYKTAKRFLFRGEMKTLSEIVNEINMPRSWFGYVTGREELIQQQVSEIERRLDGKVAAAKTG